MGEKKGRNRQKNVWVNGGHERALYAYSERYLIHGEPYILVISLSKELSFSLVIIDVNFNLICTKLIKGDSAIKLPFAFRETCILRAN